MTKTIERHVYTVAEYGESLTELGVVYRVEVSHGRCGCGAEEMKGTVAYFKDRTDAEEYARMKNGYSHPQLAKEAGK